MDAKFPERAINLDANKRRFVSNAFLFLLLVFLLAMAQSVIRYRAYKRLPTVEVGFVLSDFRISFSSSIDPGDQNTKKIITQVPKTVLANWVGITGGILGKLNPGIVLFPYALDTKPWRIVRA